VVAGQQLGRVVCVGRGGWRRWRGRGLTRVRGRVSGRRVSGLVARCTCATHAAASTAHKNTRPQPRDTPAVLWSRLTGHAKIEWYTNS
jgi:hypothetical protein